MKDNEQDNTLEGGANLEDLANFFAPSWAKDDNASRVTISGGAGRRFDDDRPRRDGDRPRRDFDGERPRRDFDGERRDRPRRDFNGERPRRDRDGERPRHDRDGERPRRDRDGERPRRDFDGERRDRPKPEEPLTLGVRFLPEGKALDAIIRRIQSTRKAYPFRDIVSLFQKDDASLTVRIEADRTTDSAAVVFQCRHCGLPALSAEEAIAHAFDAHFADFFEVREIEGEAPKGNFPCIGRCGLSGELLGPPNHHSYASRIEEVRREKFPTMSLDEFKRHIEMVRDPEVVEQWREAAKKHTLYFRIPAKEEKPASEGTAEGAAEGAADGAAAEGEAAAAAEPAAEKGLLRTEAEAIFRREIAPSLVASAPHIVCKATVLKNMPNRRLASFLSREFSHDEAMHAQGTLSRAIHGAFNHRKLVFFRANEDRGQEFVACVAPVKFDVENAAPEIKAILGFIADNPSAQQKSLVESLVPDGDEEKARPLLASLRWLVEKGYIVEFFNGILSLGGPHPTYRPGQKKPRKPDASAKPADEAKEKAGATGEAEAPATEAAPAAPAEAGVPAAAEAGAPAEAEVPAAAEAETPATEAAPAAPAEAEAPGTAETETPASAETEAPAPADAEASATETAAAAPAEAEAPAPAETETPAPAEAEAQPAKDVGNENP